MIHATAVIHPTALVNPSADIGPFTVIGANVQVGAHARIWAYVNILAEVIIGDRCSIGAGSEIGRGTTIGARSRIGSHVFLPSHTTVGRCVFIGPAVACSDDRHPRVPEPSDARYDARPPVFEDGCNVGLGAITLPGVRIGKNAMVAAGAIVTRDVPDGQMVRGEPARQFLPPPEWGNRTPLVEDAGVEP